MDVDRAIPFPGSQGWIPVGADVSGVFRTAYWLGRHMPRGITDATATVFP